MNIPRQRESAENEIYRCLVERDCPELAAFRITREDRLGKRSTYTCAFHLGQAEYVARQRFPGWGEPTITVTLAVPERAGGR